MINAILSGLLSFIANMVAICVAPIDTIVSTLFPGLGNWVNEFNYLLTGLAQSCGSYAAYVFYIIPSEIDDVLLFYVVILIFVYSASLAIHAVLKIFTIIKNIKVW